MTIFNDSRYQGEVGDAVVGRITEVGQKLWRVDVNGKQDSILQLSAITLPGGELVHGFLIQNLIFKSEKKNNR
jgi:exosome complex RNA-binding protein Rrp4